MTSNDSDTTSNERTMGQSVLYWGIVYAIAIPVAFVVLGLIVRTTLTLGM